MGKKSKKAEVSATTHELAGFFPRLLAFFIDSFLTLLLAILLFGLLSLGGDLPLQVQSFFGLAAPVFYSWYFWTRRDGQTPGKFAMGIRVVKADGSPISDVDAVIRAVGYQVSGLLFCAGYLWSLIDRKNQTWHDKLARTYVVRSAKQRQMVKLG